MIRRTALAALLLATLTQSPSRAAAPAALTGDVTFTATTTSSVLVRVPKPVSLSGEGSFNDLAVQQNPDVSVTGKGRVTGLVLTQNTALRKNPRADNDGATLVFLSYGMCSGRACLPDQPAQVTLAYGPGVKQDDDTTIHLPAGAYRLYAITDGAPVSARLRLHGLTGTSRLALSDPASSQVIEALPDSASTRYVSGEYLKLARPGLVANSALARSKVGSSISGGWCLVNRDEEDTALTDDADGPSGCASRLPDALEKQWVGNTSPTPFHGHGGQRGLVGLEDPPNGLVSVSSTYPQGSYRFDQDQQVSPGHEGVSFIALFLPWDR